MSIVAVEVVAPADAPTMTRAMLDACSASVRLGRCELSQQPTTEPRIGSATVRVDDVTERSLRVEVTGVAPDSSAVRLRVLTFKDSDAIVERWRAVGLTIATLVGDALDNAPLGEATFEGPASHGADSGARPGSQSAGGTAATGAAVKTAPERGLAEQDNAARANGDRRQLRSNDEARRIDYAPSTRTPLPRTLWATVAGVTGPGLEEGGFRFGATLDASFRPVAFPVFFRVAFGYSVRPADSRGLSVQWESAVAGAGIVVGTGAFRLEPRVGIGIENVHARVTEPVTKESDSGNALGPSFQLGLDGVFQLDHFGFVAILEGTQKHAPTQILVESHDFGTSAATGWAVGVGVRYYVE